MVGPTVVSVTGIVLPCHTESLSCPLCMFRAPVVQYLSVLVFLSCPLTAGTATAGPVRYGLR